MKYKPPKFKRLEDMAAIDVGRLTEEQARTILEKIRWPKGLTCPSCGGKDVTRLQPISEKVRDGVIQCNGCRGQFTVTVGTVMEGSHITLRQWIQAFYAMCSSKKGISALQLQRNLGLGSYHSAWHLAHRIRLAMKDSTNGLLHGDVEVDETYIGGKPSRTDKDGNPIKNKRGRGTKKAPVVALIERDGQARAEVISHVNSENLKTVLQENVSPDATIFTDEAKDYLPIGKDFKGHESVNHSKEEFARGRVHVNTDESFFSLLKRGVHGVFHHVSKKHLPQYCDEFSFRWNNRKSSDGKRAVTAIRGIVGKSLPYSTLPSA